MIACWFSPPPSLPSALLPLLPSPRVCQAFIPRCSVFWKAPTFFNARVWWDIWHVFICASASLFLFGELKTCMFEDEWGVYEIMTMFVLKNDIIPALFCGKYPIIWYICNILHHSTNYSYFTCVVKQIYSIFIYKYWTMDEVRAANSTFSLLIDLINWSV